VSKPSRRRQRAGSQPSTARPAPPPPKPASTGAAASGSPTTGSAAGAGSSKPGGSPAGGTGPTASASGARPYAASPRPVSGARAGRRARQRTAYQPSFMERHRVPIIVGAALVGVALISAFVLFSASQPAYACSTIWSPAPTASPAAGATPALGYVQPDMGRQHANIGDKVTYTYCAPASGSHYNKPGSAGPIPPRVYGPNDSVIPQGWVHNLEHGALVVLYTGSSAGATPEGQAQLRAFFDAFPPGPVCGTPKGVIGPVIARFDQMSTPFQAIVWGRVLTLDSFDQAKILAFWQQWGEKTNPEPQCAAPSPSASVAPSGSPAASESVAPSATPIATPAPSSSVAPSPS
jgi:hypothetical protein